MNTAQLIHERDDVQAALDTERIHHRYCREERDRFRRQRDEAIRLLRQVRVLESVTWGERYATLMAAVREGRHDEDRAPGEPAR